MSISNPLPPRESWWDEAVRMLEFPPQESLQWFEVPDPFNDQIPVSGFLCRYPDHRYGALVIMTVAGHEVPQLVWATPKLHYPFGRSGQFHFPPLRKAYCYEKLDGTNVLSYLYHDHCGNELFSHKLRLSPFLRNGKWGDFLEKWKALTAESSRSMNDHVRSTGCNLSFEMFGSENTHLIKYEKPLDYALLFGVSRKDGQVIHVPKLQTIIPPSSLPVPRLLGEFSASDDPVARFQALRAAMEEQNSQTSDGKIQGTEGAVLFVESPDSRTSMWKCKPESVEKIHWATGINKVAVMVTCWNALESTDSLSRAEVEKLLEEEFTKEEIERFRPHIEECVARVSSEQELRQQVWSAYDQVVSMGLDLQTDKPAVMRELAKSFPKPMMSKVYGALLARETK